MKHLRREFSERLRDSQSLGEIFEIVKDSVKLVFGRERSGLMLGLAELGIDYGRFIGAFYPVGSNLIVMNKTALRMFKQKKPTIAKPYAFIVLLHEYLHTLGILDEAYTEALTHFVISEIFGENHNLTNFARNLRYYLPKLTFPTELYGIPENIELVEDFDRSNLSYIG